MLPSGTRQRSSRPHQAWRDLVHRTGLTRSQRLFALEVVGPIAGTDGGVRAGGISNLVSRYCRIRGLASCSRRWIKRLLTGLVRAGLLAYDQHPGPGTPATYRLALFKGRRMVVRRRGVISRHVHRTFMKETDMAKMDWEGAAKRDKARWAPEMHAYDRDVLNPAVVQAKFGGRCKLCPDPIKAGDWMVSSPVGWSHQQCFNDQLALI